MKADVQPSNVGISHLVLVRPDPPGQFTAQVVGLPEIRALAATREQAVRQVSQSLQQLLASGELVQVELTGNPLLQSFGHAKDDPDFDGYLEEIRRYRQQVDDQDLGNTAEPPCSASSSTPTT